MRNRQIRRQRRHALGSDSPESLGVAIHGEDAAPFVTKPSSSRQSDPARRTRDHRIAFGAHRSST
jgi:hypothetical protein